MTIATKYKVQVAWRTLAANVRQLTRVYPKSYQIDVIPIDTNEPGFGQIEIGYYFVDWFGRLYSIINTSTNIIDVQDDFDIRYCPQSGKPGIIFKSDWKGRSLYLVQDNFRHLHPLAFSNAQKYFNALLWANDPNPRRINISSTDEPKIINYQLDQIDGFNFAEDYGEYPKVKLFKKDDDNNFIERSERPYFQMIDGLIDIITFGILDETADWIIEISK